jgi:cyclopropane-fatty-acyl-phospholipid synthase
VTLLDLDYRDLTGTFDKLVSIEMIEAVDWRDHDRFFETCAGLLGPDGNASLQAIVIAERASSGQAPRRGCGAPTSTSMPGG